MKSLIINFLGFLEPILGPIASPSVTNELENLKKTIISAKEEISELKSNMEIVEESEKELLENSNVTTVIVGLVIVTGLIFLIGYVSEDFSIFVGEIGNSLGTQINDVGRILTDSLSNEMEINNSTLESHFSTLLNRVDKLDNNLNEILNRLSSQLAIRSKDPRTSNEDFFGSWVPKNSD